MTILLEVIGLYIIAWRQTAAGTGGIVVGKVGIAVVTPEELIDRINTGEY